MAFAFMRYSSQRSQETRMFNWLTKEDLNLIELRLARISLRLERMEKRIMTAQDDQKNEIKAALEGIGTSLNNIRADVVELQKAAQAVKDAPPDQRDAMLDALLEQAKGIGSKADDIDKMNPTTGDGAGQNSEIPNSDGATTVSEASTDGATE